MTAAEATHGTVYGLVDPRNNQVRYVGQTKKTLDQRLKGHYGTASRRVRAWLEELREAGLKPLTTPLREGVPADHLQDVETEEITRIIGAGGTLLNEVKIGRGRQANYARLAAEKLARWGDLANLTRDLLGGPIPPGDLPVIEIPDDAWQYMAQVRPGHHEWMTRPLDQSLSREDRETFRNKREDWRSAHEFAERALRPAVDWGVLRWIGDDAFCKQMDLMFSVATDLPWRSRADAARAISLIPWCMVAVEPWWHLAEIGGLELDATAFTAWAARDGGTLDALEFLSSVEDDGMFRLMRLADTRRSKWETGSGHFLATVAASYSGAEPAASLRSDIRQHLEKSARDHMLTRPMGDLLMTLDPSALDNAFGEDVAAEMDRELGLPTGTSGRVLREMVKRTDHHGTGPVVRKAADRSAQTLPVTALPDYDGWCGAGIPARRSIGASLVRASLAEPDGMTPVEYLGKVRELWTPRLREADSQAA
jgi:hypothetical protein